MLEQINWKITLSILLVKELFFCWHICVVLNQFYRWDATNSFNYWDMSYNEVILFNLYIWVIIISIITNQKSKSSDVEKQKKIFLLRVFESLNKPSHEQSNISKWKISYIPWKELNTFQIIVMVAYCSVTLKTESITRFSN
jgi:hypothetical protein